MRTTKKVTGKQPVKHLKTVNKVVESVLVDKAKAWSDSVSSVSPQVVANIINTPQDLAFLRGWYNYGRVERERGHFPPTLRSAHLVLTPFGILSIAALAAGWLGVDTPWMVQSTSPPHSDAA